MKLTIIVFILAIIVNTSFAQINNGPSGNSFLKNSHTIGVKAGFLSKTTDDASKMGGFSGSIYYNYGLSRELAVEIIAGYINGGGSGIQFGTEETTVSLIPIMAGIKYYPESLEFNENARLNVYIDAGDLIGIRHTSYLRGEKFYTTDVHSRFALKFGTGFELSPSKWLRIGLNLGYFFATDFNNHPGYKNYEGLEYSIISGVVF